MPKLNKILLCHVLCVLHHVARRSCTNLMSPTNIGVCVGPSLLWSDNVTPGDLRAVPLIVETLVTHCEYLCGARLTLLLGDPARGDSGSEESDCKCLYQNGHYATPNGVPITNVSPTAIYDSGESSNILKQFVLFSVLQALFLCRSLSMVDKLFQNHSKL